MKKGVMLRVQVYIEGEGAPADDFSRTGQAVVTDVLQRGLKAYSGPYSIKVQKIDPVEGGDDDADSDADPTEITPLFAYTPSAAAAQAAPAAPSSVPFVPSAPPSAPASEQAAAPQPAPGAPPQQAQPPDEHKHHFWDR